MRKERIDYMYDQLANCPVCHGPFHVKQLGCAHCGSVLEGVFEPGRLSRLSVDMQQFVIAFLECRGNIREMEKNLNVSYPTVRARLDEIVASLGGQAKAFEGDGVSSDNGGSDGDGGNGDGGNGDSIGIGGGGDAHNEGPTRLEILTRLSNGEIDIDDARSLLGEKGEKDDTI